MFHCRFSSRNVIMTHRIHGWYIYLHLSSKSTIHVGKYTSPKDPMGEAANHVCKTCKTCKSPERLLLSSMEMTDEMAHLITKKKQRCLGRSFWLQSVDTRRFLDGYNIISGEVLKGELLMSLFWATWANLHNKKLFQVSKGLKRFDA